MHLVFSFSIKLTEQYKNNGGHQYYNVNLTNCNIKYSSQSHTMSLLHLFYYEILRNVFKPRAP